jgi:glycosyltransferase involved in cell wall biosynthesis
MSVYKSEKGPLLERALQSVWDDQTRKPDQIVLIEDGPLPAELEEVVQKLQAAFKVLCRAKRQSRAQEQQSCDQSSLQSKAAEPSAQFEVQSSKFFAEQSGRAERKVQSSLQGKEAEPSAQFEVQSSKFKDQRSKILTVVKLPVNGGLTKALNVGLQHVTSDLVARMDSDDIAAPNRFELQERFLEEHPDIDIVGGSMQEFDDEHECLNIRHYPQTHEEACKYIVKACPLAHPAVMMRKRMFDEGLKYDERYRMSQDIKLWYDAILSGYKIANLPDVCLYFRQQGDVFRRRSRVKAWNEFKIYMNGIYRMHGLFTLAYRYPIARYIFRNLPPSLVKRIYESGMRKRVLEK